jgi:hypothetical protein
MEPFDLLRILVRVLERLGIDYVFPRGRASRR